MTSELFDYTVQKVEELLDAPSSSQETRRAAQVWKSVVAENEGPADIDAATMELLDALDRHHTTIDELITFADGTAKEVMGADAAAGMLAHAQHIKAEGAKYCDCAACRATRELLAKHGRPVL